MEVKIFNGIEDKDLQEALWKIYEKAFAPDSETYPHNQISYTHESFLNAMTEETVVKFVLMDNSRLLGFAIVIDYRHPAHSPWTNFQAFTCRGKSKKFFYVNAVAIDPKHQKKGLVLPLLDRILDWGIKEKDYLIAGFDTPLEKTHIMIRLAEAYYREKGITLELIGAQNYYLLKRTNKQE